VRKRMIPKSGNRFSEKIMRNKTISVEMQSRPLILARGR
jgi:hypothetical protein